MEGGRTRRDLCADVFFRRMEEPLPRPWSAQIASPGQGTKLKYNLPLGITEALEEPEAYATALMQTTINAPPSKSPSTKALKEKWVSEVPKGVDFVRECAEAKEVAPPPRPKAELVQVGAPPRLCQIDVPHSRRAPPLAGLPQGQTPALGRAPALARWPASPHKPLAWLT